MRKFFTLVFHSSSEAYSIALRLYNDLTQAPIFVLRIFIHSSNKDTVEVTSLFTKQADYVDAPLHKTRKRINYLLSQSGKAFLELSLVLVVARSSWLRFG